MAGSKGKSVESGASDIPKRSFLSVCLIGRSYLNIFDIRKKQYNIESSGWQIVPADYAGRRGKRFPATNLLRQYINEKRGSLRGHADSFVDN
jgi:hypothetical protein